MQSLTTENTSETSSWRNYLKWGAKGLLAVSGATLFYGLIRTTWQGPLRSKGLVGNDVEDNVQFRSKNSGLPSDEASGINSLLAVREQLVPVFDNAWHTESSSNFLSTMAILDSERLVVGWQRYEDGADNVYAQTFWVNGSALTNEWLVNQEIEGNQGAPAIAALDNERLVVSWQNWQFGNNLYDTYARIFWANGSALTDEWRVSNQPVASRTRPPAIVALDSEHFVISWRDSLENNIYARVFSANGSVLSDEWFVDSVGGTAIGSDKLTIGALGNERLVVSWVGDTRTYIYARVLWTNGSILTDRWRVSQQQWRSGEYRTDPAIAILDSERFIITWQNSVQDGSGNGVYARAFSADGRTLSDEWLVNQWTQNDQEKPTVAALDSERIIISWQSNPISPDKHIYARMFWVNGSALSDEWRVTPQEGGDQTNPTVVALDGERVMISRDSRLDYHTHISTYKLIYSIPLTTAQPTPVVTQQKPLPTCGDEWLVSQDKTAPKSGHSIAALDHERIVVTWRDYRNSSTSMYARVVTSNGTGLTDEWQVNPGDSYPAIAALDSNRFVVVGWQRDSPSDSMPDKLSLRVFASNGTALWQTNLWVQDEQRGITIAALDSECLVASWSNIDRQDNSRSIYARVFGNGRALTDEWLVNQHLESTKDNPTVAALDSERLIIVWKSRYQNGSYDDIYARIFWANGSALTDESRVNQRTDDWQDYPSVARLDNERLIIAWQSLWQDSSSYGIYARIFGANGSALTDEWRVNQWKENTQRFPKIAVLSEQHFIITWESEWQDGDKYGVYARAFRADGRALTDEWRLNQWTASYQDSPAIASLDRQRFIISWESLRQWGASSTVIVARVCEFANLTLSPSPIPFSTQNTQITSETILSKLITSSPENTPSSTITPASTSLSRATMTTQTSSMSTTLLSDEAILDQTNITTQQPSTLADWLIPSLITLSGISLMGSVFFIYCHKKTPIQKDVIDKKNLRYSEVIGKGGFGVVYRGQYTLRCKAKPVAIKDLCSMHGVESLGDISVSDSTRLFHQEAQVMQQFDHKNIITLYGVCTYSADNTQCFFNKSPAHPHTALVMPLMSGSLHSFFASGKIKHWDVGKRLDVCLGIARGIEHIHFSVKMAQGYVHGDIKYSNILLDNEDVPKISDFGTSKARVEQTKLATQGRILDLPIMTPSLTAPEITEQKVEGPTKSADIYSFGLLMLTLFCGRQVNNKNWQHFQNQVPQEISKLATLCLQLDFNMRPTVKQVVETLQHLKKVDNLSLVAPLGIISEEGTSDQPIDDDTLTLTSNGKQEDSSISLKSSRRHDSSVAIEGDYSSSHFFAPSRESTLTDEVELFLLDPVKPEPTMHHTH